MIKIYGSELCPDCVACKASFDANGIKYEFIDITSSMKNLKEFLKYRDNDPVFDEIKKSGGVGIPALILLGGKITLDWEKYLSDIGLSAVPAENQGKACRLDGKGC